MELNNRETLPANGDRDPDPAPGPVPPPQRDPDWQTTLTLWIQMIFVVVCGSVLGVLLTRWQTSTFVYYSMPGSNITFINLTSINISSTNTPDVNTSDESYATSAAVEEHSGRHLRPYKENLMYIRVPLYTTTPEPTAVTHLRLARTILEGMDSSAKPCDNFYNYACGRLSKEINVLYGKRTVDSLTEVDELRKGQLISLLKEDFAAAESTPVKLPKRLYQLCMNKPKIEREGIQPFLDTLDSLGGWPVLKGDDWNKDSSWSWENLLKKLRTLGFSTNYLFDVSVRVDLNNPSRRKIYIDQPTLSIKSVYLTEDHPKAQTYVDYSVQMALALEAEPERARRELYESVLFEMKLAKISKLDEERRTTTSSMSVKELQSEYNYTNWLDFFSAMFKDTGVVINENEIIIVRNREFMKQLGELLTDHDDRTVANYIIRRVINFSTSFLPERLQSVQQYYGAVLCDADLEHPCLDMTLESLAVPRGSPSIRKHFHYRVSIPSFFYDEKVKVPYSELVNATQEQELRCLDFTTNRVPIAVGALYIRKYFNDASRRAAVRMVTYMRGAFREILTKVDWMDDITRKLALEKLDAMVFHIGYPDELMNDQKVNEYYKDLEFIPQRSYMNLVLSIDRFTAKKMFEKLRQAVNKTDWTTHSNQTAVDAFYNPTENSIQFPASYFQGQLFSMKHPNYMNYGGIGTYIGREITRGFFDHGWQSNQSGSPLDWWQIRTYVDFLEKKSCFLEQYGNYTDPVLNLKVNGYDTVVENIADNGGIKVAYYAYKQWAAENTDSDPLLPELNLTTPEQMFWLVAAQTLYSAYKMDTWFLMAFSDTAPGRFRVIGAMSNMKEFSDDFQCPSGSSMYPAKRCKIW